MTKYMTHHIKDFIITLLPTGAAFKLALESTDLIVKVVIGLLTSAWLCIRIAKAWKDFHKDE